jgi:hypothetical protein
MIAYEAKLRDNLRWGFMEGSMHFEHDSAVHKNMRQITKRLDELGIPYAVVGAMAMFFHGYQRFTTDVDLLVTREGLKKIHERLEGLGYVPPFTGSKQLRDTETGVKVKFLTSGDYPGDGKPKPVAFPDPEEARVEIEGIQFLQLAKVVELKLASGMTNAGRLKDLGDVQEMIRALHLPEDLAEQLNPFVRDKYRELWVTVRDTPEQL